jgi:hypothetical protein
VAGRVCGDRVVAAVARTELLAVRVGRSALETVGRAFLPPEVASSLSLLLRTRRVDVTLVLSRLDSGLFWVLLSPWASWLRLSPLVLRLRLESLVRDVLRTGSRRRSLRSSSRRSSGPLREATCLHCYVLWECVTESSGLLSLSSLSLGAALRAMTLLDSL